MLKSPPAPRGLLVVCIAWAALLPLLACPPPPKQQSECDRDEDCDGNLICAGPDDDVRACVAACGAENPCEAGYACMEVGGRPGCFRIQGNLQVGEPCDDDTACASGACVGEKEEKRCVAMCAADLGCPDETGCYLVGPRKVCLAPLDDRAAGEACETPRQCASGRCVTAEHLGPGAFCADACAEADPCSAGLVCVTLVIGAQVCVQPAEDGAPCTTPDICANGRCVADVGGESLCTGPCAADGACANSWQCVEDDEGSPICMPPLDDRAVGEACASSRECLSGACARFGDHGSLCAEPCVQGACEGELVCWETNPGEGYCGPVP